MVQIKSMQINPRQKKRVYGKTYKWFGLVSCNACAQGWKKKLMRTGKHVHLEHKPGGVEIWVHQ